MELCETNLRKILKSKNGSPTFNARKKIANELALGEAYLSIVGIKHCDMKPENVLIKNGIPKLADFGLISEQSGRSSYRQMGYTRRGSKYEDFCNLCKF